MAAPPVSTPYGIAPYVGRAVERIREHFRPGSDSAPKGEAFVIGVFGEWGSGKSTVLNAIGGAFQNAGPPAEGSVTLRVDFNAWRFEREEHLLIPLLKTIERTLDLYIRQLQGPTLPRRKGFSSFFGRSGPGAQPGSHASEAPPESGWQWLGGRLTLLGACTIALTRMFKLKVGVPWLGEVEVNPAEGLEAVQKQIDRATASDRPISPERKLESLYYDLYSHLHRVTRGLDESDRGQLNFVFLVDDLDRCLPEKAVEMLEAIKLFLDIEGCAFVLALDDEVIERGIAHRYRDYLRPPEYVLREQNGRANGAEHVERSPEAVVPPITGHEYLEKIVQLPFRLPRWTKAEVREFVQTRYADVLARWGSPPTDPLMMTAPPAIADPWLLDLIVAAVPPIPRNIVRAIELLEFTRGVAIDRKLGDRLQAYTLAQLVLLQLFAPQSFRFLRRGNADGWKTFEKRLLKDNAEFTDPATTDQIARQPSVFSEGFFEWWETLCDVRSADAQKADPYIDRTERPLIHYLKAARANRGGFDPRNLVLYGRDAVRVDSVLEPYFSLFAETPQGVRPAAPAPVPPGGEAPVVAAPPAAGAAAPAPPAGVPPSAPAPIRDTGAATPSTAPAPAAALTAAPRDREEFVRQLLSPSPEAWRNAISREDGLMGRTLDDRTFEELLGRLKAEEIPRDVQWLETVAPLLTATQLRTLVREAVLLRRWAIAAGLVPEPTGAEAL